jgi:transcriptional regulator with XRE-family HTH domain
MNMAIRKERIAARLLELRERENLTQEQAAARVGVTMRQWQRWEAGESVPYSRNLDQIAERFEITVGEFFEPSGDGARLDVVSSLDDLRRDVAAVAGLQAELAEAVAATQREVRELRDVLQVRRQSG